MSGEELRRSRRKVRWIGYSVWTVALAVALIGLLRAFYNAGAGNDLLSPLFLPLANFAAKVIRAVWWVPGVSDLWQLDYQYAYVLGAGLFLIGGVFIQQGTKMSQTIRNGNQLAQEERLAREQGYSQGAGPQYNINTHVRDAHNSIIGNVGNVSAEMNPTHNNHIAIRAVIDHIDTHRQELALTSQQSVQFNALLRTVREELRSQTPNRTRLQEALLSLRHIVEACTAHMLVGHWGEIVHALRQLTG
jgi:hypothetical protein